MSDTTSKDTASKDAGRFARFYRSPLGYGLAGALLYWAALPWAWSELLSKTLWPLGWIAPVWWVMLVRRQKLVENRSGEAGQGRVRRFFARPYVQLWTAGFIFWMATIHWLRLPHPATYLGWFALSFYLGFYLPLFVAVSRVAVHRLHVPAIIAAPIVWTALEYVRAYMITGFLMVALGHTQYQWIALIQISDIFGGYGVSFLVMFVAACLAQMLPKTEKPKGQKVEESKSRTEQFAWWPIVPAALALAATLVYGHQQLSTVIKAPGPKIALIQGSIDSDFTPDETRSQRIIQQYESQSFAALAEAPDVELLVWPESMYRFSHHDSHLIWPDDTGQWELNADGEQTRQRQLQDLKNTASKFGKPLVIGMGTVMPPKVLYNSAVFIKPDGYVAGRYDKMHRVLFGEYTPFADWIPVLANLTPLPSTVEAGDKAVVFDLDDTRLAPSICYETVLPHVIRRQVYDLTWRQYAEPDVLINVTNDGWFWGSSQLDQHLICGVFRAIEMRKPLLIAANTGFSAWIDSDGRIVAKGPRRAVGHIIAEPQIDPRNSYYLMLGDWFPAGCLLLTTIAAIVGLVGMLLSKRPAA